MTGTGLMTQIIGILVSGFTSFASNMGAALSTLASSIFITGTGESATISIFGTLVIVFAGISLCFSLMRWVLNFITSFGRRNR